jgi:thiol-disulfide isomerase/thioredoxin
MLNRRYLAIGLMFIAAIAVTIFSFSRSSGQSATTQPTLTIAPQAREILNQVRDAYASLKSLQITGTVDGKFDIDGVQRSDHGQFNGLYASSGAFRNEMEQTSTAGPAATQPSDDAVMGNTGDKIYLYLPSQNRYLLVDAPKGKIDLSALGGDLADLLRTQNLSLALALSGDASSELSDQASTILRVEDNRIDGQSFPAISIVYPRYDLTLSIDPQTHLLRRAAADLTKNAKLMGAQDVRAALLTMDFNNNTAAATDPAAFAWSPPAGAQLLNTATTGSDLEGKPAPAFSMVGLDGKEVSSKSLLGSVYVLDFWATWCGPCVASLPHLDQIYKDFKNQGVKFFAANQQEDKATVQKFVDDTKLSIPILMDTDGSVCAKYDPEGGIPFTVVVGKDGVVLKADFLGGNEDIIRPIIQAALKK